MATGRPRGRPRNDLHVVPQVIYPLALPDNGAPTLNPDDELVLKEAEAIRLAVLKTSDRDIARITGLSPYMVLKLKQEVERERKKRVDELEARGEDAILSDIFDELIASEARGREWSAHMKLDLPMALAGQYKEAEFRLGIHMDILLKRLPAGDVPLEKDVLSLLNDDGSEDEAEDGGPETPEA